MEEYEECRMADAGTAAYVARYLLRYPDGREIRWLTGARPMHRVGWIKALAHGRALSDLKIAEAIFGSAAVAP
jgi:hypothetical protein